MIRSKIGQVLFVVPILVLVIAAKNERKAGYILLSGKIENPGSDTLTIQDTKGQLVHLVKLNGGTFSNDTLRLDEGYYYLQTGQEQTSIYLKPGFQLQVNVNAQQFDETIKYEGKGASENNYLAKKTLLEENMGELNYYGYYAKLNEADFLKLTDSLYQVKLTLLNASKSGFDHHFALVESYALKFERLQKRIDYESMHRFLTGEKTFQVSSSYPETYSKVDLANDKFIDIPGYTNIVESYFNQLARTEMKENDSLDFYSVYLRVIAEKEPSVKIKELLAYHVGKWRLGYTKKLDDVFKQVNALMTNKDYLEEVKGNYQKLKKIAKGAPSPGFRLPDINEKMVSLSDLRGKVVYIDIWATWCLPCVKEIPALKELEESLKDKDIQFVSICKEDKKERWQKMVREKQLDGIQLFAEDNDLPFFTDYLVTGIPHFILIDREGKIIDANAKRPSDPKLKDQLKDL